MLVALSLYNVIKSTGGTYWENGVLVQKKPTLEFNYQPLEQGNTYTLIFNTVTNTGKEFEPGVCYYNIFMEEVKKGKINLLWESPLAVNMVFGHGRYPRNKICIFELSDVTENQSSPQDAPVLAGTN